MHTIGIVMLTLYIYWCRVRDDYVNNCYGCSDVSTVVMQPANDNHRAVLRSPSRSRQTQGLHRIIVASHLEAVNHCVMSRAPLRDFVAERGLSARMRVPKDGGVCEF